MYGTHHLPWRIIMAHMVQSISMTAVTLSGENTIICSTFYVSFKFMVIRPSLFNVWFPLIISVYQQRKYSYIDKVRQAADLDLYLLFSCPVFDPSGGILIYFFFFILLEKLQKYLHIFLGILSYTKLRIHRIVFDCA